MATASVAMEKLNSMERSSGWVTRNYEKMQREYAGEYVAVKGEEIKAHNEDFKKLLKNLKEKGISPQKTMVKYIYNKGEEIIL